jgi:ADP-ribosylglycohydrolase
VRNTVLCGGDTDTIAAMSGALCGALVGESALPTRWVERLENGPKGADYLRALADATFELGASGHDSWRRWPASYVAR